MISYFPEFHFDVENDEISLFEEIIIFECFGVFQTYSAQKTIDFSSLKIKTNAY